jgi:undecaprenyl-diphosphatase
MISMSFYGFIAYLFYANMKSRWKYAIIGSFSVIILLIGISRIYLGVHYASDVLAGFSAGLTWLAVFVMLVNKISSSIQEK